MSQHVGRLVGHVPMSRVHDESRLGVGEPQRLSSRRIEAVGRANHQTVTRPHRRHLWRPLPGEHGPALGAAQHADPDLVRGRHHLRRGVGSQPGPGQAKGHHLVPVPVEHPQLYSIATGHRHADLASLKTVRFQGDVRGHGQNHKHL